MDPIRIAIERPIAVVAAVLMTVLFGLLASRWVSSIARLRRRTFSS